MEFGLKEDGYIYGALFCSGLYGGDIILDEGPKEHVFIEAEIWNGAEYVLTTKKDLNPKEIGGTPARIKSDKHSTSFSKFQFEQSTHDIVKEHEEWKEKVKGLVGESSWSLEDLLNQMDQMREYGLSLRKATDRSDGQQVLSLIKAIQKLAPMITKRADEVEEGMNNLY